MKFYCDACNTKYAISDEKVHGKVLKVRCKNCGNIISVREAIAPAGPVVETDPTISTPTHLPSAEDLAVPTTQWYYALNGQTFGPFTLDGLRRKYATAEIGDATYVWHERLGAWKPVASEPAFADALAIGHKIVPSRKTLGFTGPVEAIRVIHGGPSAERAGSVPNPGHARDAVPERAIQTTPPPRPLPRAAAAETPAPVVAARPPAVRPPAKSEPAPPKTKKNTAPLPESPRRGGAKPKPAPTPEARPINDARPGNLDRLRAKLGAELGGADESMEPLPQPVGEAAIFTYANGIVPASAESSQNISTAMANDAVDFRLPPMRRPARSSPSSTSDILERVIGPTSEPPSEVSEVDDSGVIPFFPEAASQASILTGMTGHEATSESLLVDVGRMAKARRKRSAMAALVAGMFVVAVAGVGMSMALQDEVEDAPPVATVTPDHKDDLVIPTYPKDEVGKIATLDLDDELLFSEEEAGPEGEDDDEPVEPPVVEKEAPTPVKPAVALKVRVKKPVAVKVEPEPVAEVVPEKVDPLAALLAPRANRQTEIRAPEDKLLTERSEGLSKDQARRGFQRVKKSIRDCRERHNRHSAKLEAGKLKISITVEPTGSVSEFTLNPRSVQNTEFHACMTSHQGRWTFARFNGKPVVINTSVIIQ